MCTPRHTDSSLVVSRQKKNNFDRWRWISFLLLRLYVPCRLNYLLSYLLSGSSFKDSSLVVSRQKNNFDRWIWISFLLVRLYVPCRLNYLLSYLLSHSSFKSIFSSYMMFSL
uniref:Uncharacterized protein n=1 Tax=Triticum urartu TaxID=4572 RepID=A0A8R7U6S5_TRIUA